MCYFVIMMPKNEKVKTLYRLISVPRLRLPSLSRGSPGAGAAAADSRLPRDGRRRHWLVPPLGGAAAAAVGSRLPGSGVASSPPWRHLRCRSPPDSHPQAIVPHP